MSHLPASVMVESLTVIKPAPGTGAPTQVTISNPLFTYTFKRDDYRQIYFSGSVSFYTQLQTLFQPLTM